MTIPIYFIILHEKYINYSLRYLPNVRHLTEIKSFMNTLKGLPWRSWLILARDQPVNFALCYTISVHNDPLLPPEITFYATC